MSSNKYIISEFAILDLNEIWLYSYKKWSKSQADKYYSYIINEIKLISENNNLGKAVNQTRKNYFVRKVKSHLIYYRKTESNIIEIVRILHKNMDIKRRL